MPTMQQLQQALDQVLEVVMKRGDSLSPQVKSELALMLNDLAGQMQQQQAAEQQLEPPPLPEEVGPPPLPSSPLNAEMDPSVKILWRVAGGNEEAFIQYLTNFPDPSLQALIRNPAQLESTISDLRRIDPEKQPIDRADGLEESPLRSSNIEAFKYDPRIRRLVVKFHEGGTYQYGGVPRAIANLFMKGAGTAKTNGRNSRGFWYVGKSPSLGASLYQFIKQGGYPYKKIA